MKLLDGKGLFTIELHTPEKPSGSSIWQQSILLDGGPRELQFDLPRDLEGIQQLNWFVTGDAGDFVTVDKTWLEVELPKLSTEERAFLNSYAMLLSNFDLSSGLTTDRHNFAFGEFDNISSSGLQAAAAVVAWQLGYISRESANQIVERTTRGLLDLTRCNGLLPHFVKDGKGVAEYSSIDSVVALVSLIEAKQSLGLDASSVGAVLEGIAWNKLLLSDGSISHGFGVECEERLAHGWSGFGTETWLVNLAYVAATGKVTPMNTRPITFSGSGFIDELAFLFVPVPKNVDRFGIDWNAFRQQAAEAQLNYYKNHHPDHCYTRLGLFGLSAGEVPITSVIEPGQIYQAFGIGGDILSNDGTRLLNHPVVVPHYAGLIAELRPESAINLWQWLEEKHLVSPLNNVESLMVVDPSFCEEIVFNSLKGSWNLGLQTLGWGRLLLKDENPLYAAMRSNELLQHGYDLMVTEPTPQPTVLPMPVAQIVLQVESGNGCGPGYEPVMCRENASGQRTVLLKSGQSRTLTLNMPSPGGIYSITLRYSNDGPTAPPDIIDLMLDGTNIGQITTIDTRGGVYKEPGTGWNEFTSATVGSFLISPGSHQLDVRASFTDFYGVEPDKVTLSRVE